MNLDLSGAGSDVSVGNRVRFQHHKSNVLAVQCTDDGDGYAYGDVVDVCMRSTDGKFTFGEVCVAIDGEFLPNCNGWVRQHIEYELVEVLE